MQRIFQDKALVIWKACLLSFAVPLMLEVSLCLGSSGIRVAVLPFETHTENDVLLRTMIPAVVSLELEKQAGLEVLNRTLVNEALADEQKDSSGKSYGRIILNVSRRLDAEWVVVGKMEKKQRLQTTELVAMAINTRDPVKTKSFEAEMSMEEQLVNGLQRLSRQVREHIITKSDRPVVRNIIPSVNTGPSPRIVWRSQILDFEVKRMAVGKITENGEPYILLMGDRKLGFYQQHRDGLKMIHMMQAPEGLKYVYVSLGDINHNGRDEIFLSAVEGEYARSMILEVQGERFATLARDLPFHLSILSRPGAPPILIGQESSPSEPFKGPLFELSWEETKYVKKRFLNFPRGLTVFNFALLSSVDEERGRFVTVDEKRGHLRILSSEGKLLWESSREYAQSNHYLERVPLDPQSNFSDKIILPARLFALHNGGAKEPSLLVIRNSYYPMSMLFQEGFLKEGELQQLRFGGMAGVSEEWSLDNLGGFVADFAVVNGNSILLALVKPTLLGNVINDNQTFLVAVQR